MNKKNIIGVCGHNCFLECHCPHSTFKASLGSLMEILAFLSWLRLSILILLILSLIELPCFASPLESYSY
jgi:hypothetical protein